MDNLRSPADAEVALDELTAEVEGPMAEMVEQFLTEVIDDAIDALSAPVLLAAGGRRRDPFAFTNVMERWHAGIGRMARATGHVRVRPYRVREILEQSDLPATAYRDVVETLREAQEEGASDLAVRRRLSAQLIPKESSGKWDTRASYRTSVSTMARTTATQNFNENQLTDMRRAEAPGKEWVTATDDRVRSAHRLVHGEVVPLDDYFMVDGFPMAYPGDPQAPVELIANCRCFMVASGLDDLPDYDDVDDLFDDDDYGDGLPPASEREETP